MSQAELPGVLSQAHLRAQQCAEKQNRDHREMMYWLADAVHWSIVEERCRRNAAQAASTAAPAAPAADQPDLFSGS